MSRNLMMIKMAINNTLSGLPLEELVETINVMRETISEHSPFKSEPVDFVRWVRNDKVYANDYNPNSVAPPEMELLRVSIDADGYTQPIVSMPDDEGGYEVIDGFHRHRCCSRGGGSTVVCPCPVCPCPVCPFCPCAGPGLRRGPSAAQRRRQPPRRRGAGPGRGVQLRVVPAPARARPRVLVVAEAVRVLEGDGEGVAAIGPGATRRRGMGAPTLARAPSCSTLPSNRGGVACRDRPRPPTDSLPLPRRRRRPQAAAQDADARAGAGAMCAMWGRAGREGRERDEGGG